MSRANDEFCDDFPIPCIEVWIEEFFKSYSPWVKCSDHMPEKEKYILGHFKDCLEPAFCVIKLTESIYRNGEVWSYDDGEFEYTVESVDFWQELPEPPKEDE